MKYAPVKTDEFAKGVDGLAHTRLNVYRDRRGPLESVQKNTVRPLSISTSITPRDEGEPSSGLPIGHSSADKSLGYTLAL
jgi:hypothetical protein